MCGTVNVIVWAHACASWLQGSTQGHWRFPEEGHEQGLVYLMTHPGTPCMFYDDLLDDKKKNLMQKLIALRQKAGIHCRSEVRLTMCCE